MQHRSFASKPVQPHLESATNSLRSPSSSNPESFSKELPRPAQHELPQKDLTAELAKIFNTALVTSQAGAKRDFSAELLELTESASFKAILSAIRNLSRVHSISEKQAAEQVIHTFRKLDKVWGEYLFREGIERLRNPRG